VLAATDAPSNQGVWHQYPPSMLPNIQQWRLQRLGPTSPVVCAHVQAMNLASGEQSVCVASDPLLMHYRACWFLLRKLDPVFRFVHLCTDLSIIALTVECNDCKGMTNQSGRSYSDE
jgi:hypothetical protein